MSIPDDILKGLKCCLSEDGHYIYEPVSLKCGANACRKCIHEDLERNKCYNCLDFHDKQDYRNSEINVLAKNVINLFLNDLIQDLEDKLGLTQGELKGILIIKYLLRTYLII
jgi:hypothetical protein